MKKLAILGLLFLIVFSFAPKPVNAGGNGWAIGGAALGGFLLGSILGPHDRIVVGPVYSAYPSYAPYGYYPPPVYYQPPVVYQPPVYYQPSMTYSPPVYYPPTARWIPDHYEWRWQTVCEIMYQRQNCYPTQITVFIPGHWEY